MCFELDSVPPIPVIRGAAVSHDDLVLESADGTAFAAFAATPDEPGRTGIVILPDVRGLYRFYEELALRFAERGYPAVAFDYFGRTAGAAKRDDGFEYMEHVRQTTPAGSRRTSRRAWRTCRPACDAIFTVGFCFGGRQLAGSRRRVDTVWPARSASMAAPAPARTEAQGPPSVQPSSRRRSSR